MFSDPKETISALEERQERRRLTASSVSSSPCPEPPCEQRDPLISGEKVGGKRIRVLKPISRMSQQFALNSASSRLQVTTHFLNAFLHASHHSLRSRASPLSQRSRASPHSLRSRASPHSQRSAASRRSFLAPEPRLALLAPERRLASLATPRSGAASRLTRRSSSLARSDRFFKYFCPLCWNYQRNTEKEVKKQFGVKTFKEIDWVFYGASFDEQEYNALVNDADDEDHAFMPAVGDADGGCGG